MANSDSRHGLMAGSVLLMIVLLLVIAHFFDGTVVLKCTPSRIIGTQSRFVRLPQVCQIVRKSL